MRVGVIGGQHGLARHLLAVGVEPMLHLGGTDAPGAGSSGLTIVDDPAQFMALLDHPRFFLLDLPLGAAIDQVIDRTYLVMEPGDVVLDPSGSYWGDTLRRFRRMRHRSLFYVDLALIGSFPGGTILAAGDDQGVDLALPLLRRLARPGAVVRAGGAGAAHYALMIHDAAAMITAQAVGEAQQMLEAYPNRPDAAAIMAELWPQPADAGARASWLLDDAVRLGASVPVLALGVMLAIGHALDEERATDPAPRVGGFVDPSDLP